MVADSKGRVHLVNCQGELLAHVLTADDISLPDRLYNDDSTGRLLVAQHDKLANKKVLIFEENPDVMSRLV